MTETSANRVEDAVIEVMCEAAHDARPHWPGTWQDAPRSYQRAARSQMRSAYQAVREHIDDELYGMAGAAPLVAVQTAHMADGDSPDYSHLLRCLDGMTETQLAELAGDADTLRRLALETYREKTKGA